jgi:hypothetical protein
VRARWWGGSRVKPIGMFGKPECYLVNIGAADGRPAYGRRLPVASAGLGRCDGLRGLGQLLRQKTGQLGQRLLA